MYQVWKNQGKSVVPELLWCGCATDAQGVFHSICEEHCAEEARYIAEIAYRKAREEQCACEGAEKCAYHGKREQTIRRNPWRRRPRR